MSDSGSHIELGPTKQFQKFETIVNKRSIQKSLIQKES